eukprot:TRINITY_DN4508_c0_g1_i1.p1 TRINITY_DN4508_c0_g1~~TRINITY_DN4508_c0_g1_i1.p1  ORF type:complete len:117 (-),score=18.57 TRINITY_DN4508_c0_g1_i1:239-589(-)
MKDDDIESSSISSFSENKCPEIYGFDSCFNGDDGMYGLEAMALDSERADVRQDESHEDPEIVGFSVDRKHGCIGEVDKKRGDFTKEYMLFTNEAGSTSFSLSVFVFSSLRISSNRT